MDVSALLTSAGINVGICVVLLSLYSVLRKQPGNVSVYFGRRLQERNRSLDSFSLERFVPSPGWIVKAWQTSEEEILASAGLDAVAFIRMLVFSIRVFSIAAGVCLFGVLPLNYYGQYRIHVQIPSESLDVFTIANVQEGSHWLWVHCLALYIISFSACILLYFEYKRMARMRIAHITRSSPNPSHFTVLVRSIPSSAEESLGDCVKGFFKKYHASSYLSHQMIFRVGKVQKLMNYAEKVYRVIGLKAFLMDGKCCPLKYSCGLCGGANNSLELCSNGLDLSAKKTDLSHSDSSRTLKECAAAFVFFKTRYGAVVASEVLQSSNPMSWVTDLAPEPQDVFWSNLWIPYRQLWFRRIATLMGSISFVIVFIFPVAFVQGLSQLNQLQKTFPFLKGIMKKGYVKQLVTGYLPSVILVLFLYIVPPVMMLFSTVEGPLSHSGRKRSACYKVLYFNIWNVFFANVLSGSVISQLNTISSPKEIPTQLAKAVPLQATFFITYVLTSGWASVSSEAIQLFGLIWNFVRKYVLGRKDDLVCVPSFPYHTEVPRVLLFGLLGFTCAILAPLILPILLVYFMLGFVVYRNQFLNVYIPKYETGGQMWPIAHNTTIFSLLLAQIIALGVFGLKKSPVASGFVIPLLICTLLFNEYCRQRFHPIFKGFSAQDLIDMDREDDECGRMDDIHQQLLSAYCQFSPDTNGAPDTSSSCKANGTVTEGLGTIEVDIEDCSKNSKNEMHHPTIEVDVEDCSKNPKNEIHHPTVSSLPAPMSQPVVASVRMLPSPHSKNPTT